MTVLDMIKEWRKGCGCSEVENQSCHECSVALIEAIERRMSNIPVCDNTILLTRGELAEFMHDWRLDRVDSESDYESKWKLDLYLVALICHNSGFVANYEKIRSKVKTKKDANKLIRNLKLISVNGKHSRNPFAV